MRNMLQNMAELLSYSPLLGTMWKSDPVIGSSNCQTAQNVPVRNCWLKEITHSEGKVELEEARKALPRWRKSALDFEHGAIGETIDGRDVLSYKGYEIILEDIFEKLPKEDEK